MALHPTAPGIVIPPPLLFVFPLAAAYLGERLLPTSFVHDDLRWVAGSFIVLAGLILNIAGFMTQRRAGTDPIPFHPTTRIVSHGLYRFSRNPMYIGFGLWTLGIALLMNSVWMLLAGPIGLILTDRLVIAREEHISSENSVTNISATNVECGAGSNLEAIV